MLEDDPATAFQSVLCLPFLTLRSGKLRAKQASSRRKPSSEGENTGDLSGNGRDTLVARDNRSGAECGLASDQSGGEEEQWRQEVAGGVGSLGRELWNGRRRRGEGKGLGRGC